LAFNVPGQEPAIQIHESIIPYFNPAGVPVTPISVILYTVPFER
jgi:hypothetical protein